MHFLDDSLLPENQQKLVIQVAPYGPQWSRGDSDDIPVSMAQQVQKAVDCWNAGATVLHVHVREEDGKGSKRLSKFNELLARLREAVPQAISACRFLLMNWNASRNRREAWLTSFRNLGMYRAIIDSAATVKELGMANLIVRDIDESLVQALKERAARHGRSAEAEHREILAIVLRRPRKRRLAEVLAAMPNVGHDVDFARVEDAAEAQGVPG